MRRYHDIGGTPSGALDRTEHEALPWEKRVEAVKTLLHISKLMSRDEFRQGIETLGADVYAQLSYAERRMAAITNILIQRGVTNIDELGRKMAEVEKRDRHRL